MHKNFCGWSIESQGKGTVDTKYIIEYVHDAKTWEKVLTTDDCGDLYTRREFDNISEALSFYMTWFVSDKCYDIKMWEEIYVNGEMILEQFIEPTNTVMYSMRTAINRDMAEQLYDTKEKVNELQNENDTYAGFIRIMGDGFKKLYNEYIDLKERKTAV